MKVLHLSFHHGCQNDIKYISEKLGFELDFMIFTDGVTRGNDIYNVTSEKAKNSWDKLKDYYNLFDCIITSDTAPISRVFLQNNWEKKLIIWICNRFDYSHQPTTEFPDQEYYDLINDAKNRPNVKIIGYTPFENYYTNNIKMLDIGNEIIKPIGLSSKSNQNYNLTKLDDKKNTFFVGPYHNDNLMMNLKETLEHLDLKVYNGRYHGIMDLNGFKGIIHIPYAWSNFSLFEAFQYGVIFFIPSFEFLKILKHDKDFFWSPPYVEEKIDLSEWYCEEHKDLIIYFDDWADLLEKTDNLDYTQHKRKLREFGKKHEKEMLKKWRKCLEI